MCDIHIPVDAGDAELFQEMAIEQEILSAYRFYQQKTMHVPGYLSLSNRKY